MLPFRDLVAYWQFEDTAELDKGGAAKLRMVAKDSSGNGNHLPLVTPPQAADIIIHNDVSGVYLPDGILSGEVTCPL